jgi:hypothetical protein
MTDPAKDPRVFDLPGTIHDELEVYVPLHAVRARGNRIRRRLAEHQAGLSVDGLFGNRGRVVVVRSSRARSRPEPAGIGRAHRHRETRDAVARRLVRCIRRGTWTGDGIGRTAKCTGIRSCRVKFAVDEGDSISVCF